MTAFYMRRIDARNCRFEPQKVLIELSPEPDQPQRAAAQLL
jgi:hypothetical protein